MKTTLGVGQHQRGVMSAQLVQQIRLLALSGMELECELANWLDVNVMLEREDAADDDTGEPQAAAESTATDEAGPEVDEAVDHSDAQLVVDSGWDDGRLSGAGTRAADDDDRPLPERMAQDPVSQLLRDLPLEVGDTRTLAACMALLEAVDERGWLDAPITDIALSTGIAEGELLSALALLRRLAPPGFAARDLEECFRLQLEAMPASAVRDTALAVVGEGLSRLARRELEAVRRAVRATPSAFAEAMALLRRLDPHPGRAACIAEAVVPDVLVRRRDGRWTVELSETAAPKLRINAAYAGVVDTLGREGQGLRQQLHEARWLLRGLQMRADTLLRVAHAIFARQFDFLGGGDEALRPLTLREIASQVGVHESTVSRVTTAKYVATPRGLFELKHFFGGGLSDCAEESGVASNVAARARVRRLIEGESAEAPLDDGTIAARLEQEGIRIARRTVAKYREALGYPPARMRGAVALAG